MRDRNQTLKYAARSAISFVAAAWLIMVIAYFTSERVPGDDKHDTFDTFAKWIPGLAADLGKWGSLVLLSGVVAIVGAGVGVVISRITDCCEENTDPARQPLRLA